MCVWRQACVALTPLRVLKWDRRSWTQGIISLIVWSNNPRASMRTWIQPKWGRLRKSSSGSSTNAWRSSSSWWRATSRKRSIWRSGRNAGIWTRQQYHQSRLKRAAVLKLGVVNYRRRASPFAAMYQRLCGPTSWTDSTQRLCLATNSELPSTRSCSWACFKSSRKSPNCWIHIFTVTIRRKKLTTLNYLWSKILRISKNKTHVRGVSYQDREFDQGISIWTVMIWSDSTLPIKPSSLSSQAPSKVTECLQLYNKQTLRKSRPLVLSQMLNLMHLWKCSAPSLIEPQSALPHQNCRHDLEQELIVWLLLTRP